MALALEHRGGRSDVVVWVVPCLDASINPDRESVWLKTDDTRGGWFSKQCKDSVDFLTRCGKGAVPRMMLVLVWHERCKEAAVWGFLSTAVQFRVLPVP